LNVIIYFLKFAFSIDVAASEKSRLEEAQRERRKTQVGENQYKGKWFKLKKHPLVKDDTWQFTNEYWNRQYDDCIQLY
jgi:hypothetical protein